VVTQDFSMLGKVVVSWHCLGLNAGHLITQPKACRFTPLDHYITSRTVKCIHIRFSK